MKELHLKRVLVLGGSGQIGKPLCQYLEQKNIEVVNVDLILGPEHDLRCDTNLAKKWIDKVDFVFFLAYDIGGAKYLQNQQTHFQFIMNNTKIMGNVFQLLHDSKVPFIFASSVMAEMPWSSYGSLKRLGEHFTKALGGITARFWNVYGPEEVGERSHVIPDFIQKAKGEGVINMMTDGSEVRQFLFVDDCTKILLTLAQKYELTSQYETYDISNFVWTDIETVAHTVASHYKARVIKPNNKDSVQHNRQIEPNPFPLNLFWDITSATTLQNGVEKMIAYYENQNA